MHTSNPYYSSLSLSLSPAFRQQPEDRISLASEIIRARIHTKRWAHSCALADPIGLTAAWVGEATKRPAARIINVPMQPRLSRRGPTTGATRSPSERRASLRATETHI